jgi:hypothetical protein
VSSWHGRPRAGHAARELLLFQVLAALVFGLCLMVALFMYWVAPLLSS